MANELRAATTTGRTCYALIINSQGKFWNGTAFETYASGNYATYDIAMTESGTSGIYLGNFPPAITSSGSYEYFVKRQDDVSPAEDDAIVNTGELDWTGTTIVSANAGSMSGSDWRNYVLRQGFKRTDKDDELYECTTDAIQEMRRRFRFDEAEAEAITTDTISVLGDYRLNIENDLGLLVGVTLEDDENATPLIRVSKEEFNALYPDINVTNDRGYPLHYCLYSGSIQVGPAPDRTSYSYRVAYSTRAGVITAVTVSVPFTNAYRDVLLDLTLSRLYNALDDFDKGNFYRSQFEAKFLHSKQKEYSNRGDGFFAVRPFGM